MNAKTTLVGLALLALFSPSITFAGDKPFWISGSIDNDLFVGSDDGYTNGVFFTSFEFVPDPTKTTNLLPWYFQLQSRLVGAEAAQAWVKVHNVSQVMTTPTDIEAEIPDTTDLPYAGFLYWQGGVAAIRERSTTYVSMLMGAVGPIALAEHTQTAVHRAIGSAIPQGWDYQIENEPLLGLSGSYFVQRMHHQHSLIETDIVAGVNASLGNYRSGLGGSAFLRFGKRLSDSHGTFAMISGREINPVAREQGWFGYLGAVAYYELNNMVFQGNSSSGNSSLQWDQQFGGATTGLAFSGNRWGFSFNYSDMGSLGNRYFGRQKFGSLSILYKLR